jgi:lipid kinase YegS
MDSLRHFVFVMHGARAERPSLRHVVHWVREKGHRVDARVSWERGDAVRFAEEAVAAGADAVVAVGGDGTVNEVVNGLSGSATPLGIIPVGTANDFARQAGIPSDPDHAMDIVLRSAPVRVDTAELNGRRFLNVSTGGVGAEATAETGAEAKEALGSVAYAFTGMRKLRTLRPRRATFAGPDFEYRGDFLLFAVGNARLTGGGTAITPRASVVDGLLDLCIVRGMPRGDFARLLLRIKRGEHVGHESVVYAQLPRLTIESAQSISVNVDGEPTDGRRLEYRARAADLLVHVARLPDEATIDADADESRADR